ncbi:zinc-dependent metalloprotease family protein [Spirochaeta cellobiosiphila]|uniref:zinc-dependent metalloprotease family protein n=1 Tax=Spirochaeta cellobiosiphila TaxID=504483 RepID=UPI00040C1B39|nr:zinc-dependent metalloprotease family protein [Spirochaeta cellobiosiphila]
MNVKSIAKVTPILLLTLITSCNLFFSNSSDDDIAGHLIIQNSSSYSPKEIYITEVGASYYSNSSIWFEVYNPNNVSVNLSAYSLRSYGTNNSQDDVYVMEIPLHSYTLAPHGYAVLKIKNSHSPDSLHSQGDFIPTVVYKNVTYHSFWSDSGYVELVRDGVTYDFIRFGNCSIEPQSGYFSGKAEGFPSSLSSYKYYGYYGNSLSRNQSSEMYIDTDSNNDWALRKFSTPSSINDITNDTDADNDGIPDQAESPGGTYGGLPLYDYGARTGKKDIFVYVSYMDPTSVELLGYNKSNNEYYFTGSRGYDAGVDPQIEAFNKVVEVFEANNISLHINIGNKFSSSFSKEKYNLDNTSHEIPYSRLVSLGNYSSSSNLYDIKAKYFPMVGKWIYHYCVFGFLQGAGNAGSSGIAELGTNGAGNDLIITLGGVWDLNTDSNEKKQELINLQASTFMHELGHNLGLHHGGDEDQNYKPNYYSVMNYLYQLYGLPDTNSETVGDRYYLEQYNNAQPDIKTRWLSLMSDSSKEPISFGVENGPNTSSFSLDYSHGMGNDIDEKAINENDGIGQGNARLDYNGNKSIDASVSYDINFTNGEKSKLKDYDDWSNLIFAFSRDFYADSRSTSNRNLEDIVNDRMPYAEEIPLKSIAF